MFDCKWGIWIEVNVFTKLHLMVRYPEVSYTVWNTPKKSLELSDQMSVLAADENSVKQRKEQFFAFRDLNMKNKLKEQLCSF